MNSSTINLDRVYQVRDFIAEILAFSENIKVNLVTLMYRNFDTFCFSGNQSYQNRLQKYS